MDVLYVIWMYRMSSGFTECHVHLKYRMPNSTQGQTKKKHESGQRHLSMLISEHFKSGLIDFLRGGALGVSF